MTRATAPKAFMGTRSAKTAKGANIAVFSANHGTPYRSIDNKGHAKSGDAFRQALSADAEWLHHHDFDFDGPLIPPGDFKAVDLGSLATLAADGRGNRRKIEAVTRAILKEGAVPLMFGGDDSTPIPFITAFSGGPPLTIIQLDAHIDWRDERHGERHGFSSTMRRASEQPHVWRIVQAGARGIGSARPEEVEAARQWGARLIPAARVHQDGVEAILQHVEPFSDCLIALDLDVLDSAVMPAVAYPSPGGFSFLQVTDVIAAIASRARIAGFCMVEFVPKKDVNGVAAFTAGRIAAHVIGHVARQKPGP